MEYIGETGRQLKIRIKEHETDSKVDFQKKQGKKENKFIWSFGKFEKEKTSIRLEFD